MPLTNASLLSFNSVSLLRAAQTNNANQPPTGGRTFAENVSGVASARCRSLPEIDSPNVRLAGRHDVDRSVSIPAFRDEIAGVSMPEADASVAALQPAATQPAVWHEESTLEEAHACLKRMMPDRVDDLTMLLEALAMPDLIAIEDLARTVHALHLAAGPGQFDKAFRDIGKVLATLVKSAKAAKGGLSQVCNREMTRNKHYEKLCEIVVGCVRTAGMADAMFRIAKARAEAAAADRVSASVGGRLEGNVRELGIVNPHAGGRQLWRARHAFASALRSPYPVNAIHMAATGLGELSMTDQLLNRLGSAVQRPESDKPPDETDTAATTPSPRPDTPQSEAASVVQPGQAAQGSLNIQIDLGGFSEVMGGMVSALLDRFEQLSARTHPDVVSGATVLNRELAVHDPSPTRPGSEVVNDPVVDGRATPATGRWTKGAGGKWRMTRETPWVSTANRVWSAEVLNRMNRASIGNKETSIDEFVPPA